MDTSKIIIGTVGGGRYTVTAPIVKEDYGLYLKIEGLELPSTYEVDFSNSEHNGTSVTMIGNSDGVLIPSQFISSGKDVFAFLYHVGADFGRTVYKFRIPNKLRPDRTNEEPTPEQESTIDQAINALNNAVEQTSQDVLSAYESAQNASASADRAERSESASQLWAETAENYSDSAEQSASQASASATASAQSAEASARCSADAQDSAEEAQASASASAQSATASANSASQASASATSANQSATSAQGYASQAQTSAQSASESAEQAQESARTAGLYSDTAQTYANSAEISANSASASATASAQSAEQSAQIKADVEDLADDAQASASASANSASQASASATSAIQASSNASDMALSAQTYSEIAQNHATHAGQSVQTASTKATESAQSASLALTYKTDAESAKTASQTAQGLAESARDSAISAKESAEDARDEAQSIVDGISGKVDQIDQNTADIASLEDDIFKPYAVDSASGAIASFVDGADDIPLKSLAVDINPIQDLHGQDAPYPAGGGKNLLQYPFNFSGQTTINGVTFTDNGDGILTINGTATANAQIDLYTTAYANMLKLENGETYTLSTNSDGNLAMCLCVLYSAQGTYVSEINTRVSSGFTVPNDGDIRCRIVCRIISGTVCNNIKFAPQLEKGSTATAYAPYENLCPISGWTEVDVEQRGKNIYDIKGWLDKLSVPYTESNGYVSFTPTSPCYSSFFELPSGTKTLSFEFSGESTATNIRFRVKYANGTIDANANTKKTGDIVGVALNWSSVGTIKVKAQIEFGSTATSYSPYTGRSISIQLGQTVYGGKLDVLRGELVIDRAMVDLGTLSWLKHGGVDGRWTAGLSPMAKPSGSYDVKTNAICERYNNITQNRVFTKNVGIATHSLYGTTVFVYDPSFPDAATFKSAMNGVQLVYELAEPITYHLTPTEVQSLLGTNHVWADSGDTDVEYRADTKLFIERLTAPDSADMIADANITSGQYFMVGNSLYKATANIANGGQIIVGTNCIRKSLSEALNEINA